MYGVNISHTHEDLVDCGNGALNVSEPLSKRKDMERVPYIEIRETDTQLPNIKLKGIVGSSRSELRCLTASIIFRFREGAAKRKAN